MAHIRCFVLNPTNLVRVWLRRYRGSGMDGHVCPTSKTGYHNAEILRHDRIERDDAHAEERSNLDRQLWPSVCACGYQFQDDDRCQYFTRSLYVASPGPYAHQDSVAADIPLVTTEDAGPGALMRATWLEEYRHYSALYDNQSWQVKLPTGDFWQIDATASNCDSPCKHCGQPYHSHAKERCTNPGRDGLAYTVGAYEDSKPDHRCWVRHGVAPDFHVDKSGLTCGAGGGSIWSRQGRPNSYHGFLHHGHLDEC